MLPRTRSSRAKDCILEVKQKLHLILSRRTTFNTGIWDEFALEAVYEKTDLLCSFVLQHLDPRTA